MFLSLSALDGTTVMLNTDYIISICESDGFTEIVVGLTGCGTYCVLESLDEIAEYLTSNKQVLDVEVELVPEFQKQQQPH